MLTEGGKKQEKSSLLIAILSVAVSLSRSRPSMGGWARGRGIFPAPTKTPGPASSVTMEAPAWVWAMAWDLSRPLPKHQQLADPQRLTFLEGVWAWDRYRPPPKHQQPADPARLTSLEGVWAWDRCHPRLTAALKPPSDSLAPRCKNRQTTNRRLIQQIEISEPSSCLLLVCHGFVKKSGNGAELKYHALASIGIRHRFSHPSELPGWNCNHNYTRARLPER
jgi:hypothetical protein